MCLALELAGSGVELDFSMGKETFGEGNGNPLQYSCLDNPMDGGAWWATVHGVTKTQTWLKQLSMNTQTYTQVRCPETLIIVLSFTENCKS